MSPVVLGGIAAAAGGALLVGVGIAAGRWQARRDWAAHRDYITVLERDLAELERDCDHLATEAATFPERLQAAYDAGLQGTRQVRDAGVWPLPDRVLLPPRTWAALREAQENWEAN